MAFVHEQSCECTKSELDLFSVPPTQTSIESGTWAEYHPLSSITDGAPIEFEVSGTVICTSRRKLLLLMVTISRLMQKLDL